MTYPKPHCAPLCGLVLAALFALSPSRAAASREGVIDLESEAIAGTLLVSTGLAFGVTDLIFIAVDRPTPTWLSLLQIGLSGLFLPVNALLATDSVALGATAVGTGLWFTSFGIYNLAVYPKYRRERARERTYGLAVASRAAGGGMVQLYARL